MKAIIPCAGFGTRMKVPANKSKEMLKDPYKKGKFIIDYSLEICKIFKLDPLIITRKEKTDLKQYIFNRQSKFIDIIPEGEWYNSVLKSKDHWEEDNLLILPDTRFQSWKVIDEIQQGLKLGNNAVFALHTVTDPHKWGIIEDYKVLEKPDMIGKRQAWGLIGFKRSYGEELFFTMKEKSVTLDNVGFCYLSFFKDITRGTK